jgi:hypothetical protein
MINHKYKFLFIHIPKTSGRSTELCLNRRCGKDDTGTRLNGPLQLLRNPHKTLDDYYKIYSKQELKSYFKFTIVRNPFDRIVSEYFYSRKRRLTQSRDFKTFVVNGEIDTQSYPNHNIPQIDFFVDKKRIDYIAKFENLQEDFKTICDKIKIPHQELPHHNNTKHKHYTEYYDDETRQIVAEKYAKDIEYFNYEFGE